jgi:uncharacterized cupin superfamily protein
MEISEVFHPRRVVTGLNAEGKSCLARVEEIHPARVEYAINSPIQANLPTWTPPRTGYHRVWASDRLPVPLPSDGLTPPIDSNPTPDETPEHLRRAYAVPPPLGFRAAWVRGRGPQPIVPMHWHDSTDFKIMMAGEQGYVHDDGTEIVLRAGDVIVQNATHHAQQDFSENNAIQGYIVVGGLRVGAHPPYETLHPVQRGPVGGHRSGEIRGKQPSAPWTAPAPPPPKFRDAGTVLSMSEVERPRRIVTGNRPDGTSCVARCEEVEATDHPIFGTWFPIWGSDRLPLYFPTDGLAPPFDSFPTPEEAREALRRSHFLPPPLGYRVGIAKLDPSERPGVMHWYDSVEVYFIMHGEVTHMLDSGEAIDLRAGDVLIQNGTNHAWHNRGDGPVWLAIGAFGAVRFGAHPPLASLHPVQRGSGNRPGERR